MSKGTQLTEKEKLFVELFIKYNQKEKAYKEAYGTEKRANNAKRILDKPEVKEYLEYCRQQAFEDFCIDARHIATALGDIAFNEDNSNKDRLKALDLLQKQLGLQTQKVSAEVETTIEVSIE